MLIDVSFADTVAAVTSSHFVFREDSSDFLWNTAAFVLLPRSGPLRRQALDY
jgi:hypothetical protein